MICVVIVGPTFEEAADQIDQANRFGDLLEFRLDRFAFFEKNKVAELKRKSRLPVIFNFPKKLENLRRLAYLQPAYMDIPFDADPLFLKDLHQQHPKTKIICSYHNFEETPKDLEQILASMRNPYASYYKIAVMSNSSLDALRMLLFTQTQLRKGHPIIGIGMGGHGEITRILAPVYGSLFTYCSVDAQHTSAPGQIDVQTMVENYHYRALNDETKVMGLIGDPIAKSPSHVTHNAVLRQLGVKGVYVKMQVLPDQLADFLKLVQQLHFHGLSVTIPLKEAVIPYISEFDEGSEAIGAINTLMFSGNEIRGKNTDTIGALDAIEEHLLVSGKTVVIIGAGGAGKGIAYEAKTRGAKVILLNRTPEKAKAAADRLGVEWGGFEDFDRIAKRGYDVIVNALASSADSLPFFDQLLPNKVAMDVVYDPRETPFLLAAKTKNGTLVYGDEMFVRQAVKQFSFWFNEVDEQLIKETIETRIKSKYAIGFKHKDTKTQRHKDQDR